MKVIRLLIAGAAALFVAACLPVTTKNPVGSTVGFKPDPALVGIWKGHGEDKDDKDGYIAFLANDDGSMTALLIAPDEKSGEWEAYTLKTATLGANHFLNVWGALKSGKPVDDQESGADILMLYRIGKDGKLALYLLDDKATAAAIKAGKIDGVVDPGNFGDTHITAEPKSLDAFFTTKEGVALFSQKLLEFKKLE